MPLRPLAPMSPARIEWETQVTHHVCELAECSNSDAQAILEADPDGVDRLFTLRMVPIEAARSILDIVCTPGPTGPTAEELAAATALLDQPWKLPAPSIGNVSFESFASVRDKLADVRAELEQVKRANVGALASLGEDREERDKLRALAVELLSSLKIHHEWSENNLPGYNNTGSEAVAYRSTWLALAKAQELGL